jgi:hypothetical protein
MGTFEPVVPDEPSRSTLLSLCTGSRNIAGRLSLLVCTAVRPPAVAGAPIMAPHDGNRILFPIVIPPSGGMSPHSGFTTLSGPGPPWRAPLRHATIDCNIRGSDQHAHEHGANCPILWLAAAAIVAALRVLMAISRARECLSGETGAACVAPPMAGTHVSPLELRRRQFCFNKICEMATSIRSHPGV